MGDVVASMQSAWSLDKIANEFDLTPGQIHAALSYYHDHRDEIDSQLRESDEIAEAAQREQESRKA